MTADVTIVRSDETASNASRTSEVRQLPTIPGKSDEKPSQYHGRFKVWPGWVLLGLAAAIGIALITVFAIEARNAMMNRRGAFNDAEDTRFAIGGNKNDTDTTSSSRNPPKYPPRKCILPNYVSKNGQIYAQGRKGESVSIGIKGINWFGMETSLAIPFGLWANDMNGTTINEIVRFLSNNRFNSVRLPLCVAHILNNQPPLKNVVNTAQNKALNVTNYLSALSSVILAFGSRNISILLDIHTLTPTESGGLPWKSPAEAEAFLDAVDILTTNFCSDKYWNIVGLDLKNEPYLGTWGDGTSTDFRLMAETIGNRMLAGCPQWLAFVEGIAGGTSIVDGTTRFSFSSWWGGGLVDAGGAPVVLKTADKVVYSPHYYTPAVYPQPYFLKSGVQSGDIIVNFKELNDVDLTRRVQLTTDAMFGYLRHSQDAALVMGEFGGLYTQDLHPMKTTQRVTQILIEILKQPGYSGGYIWSLNPESAYQFNPSSARVNAHEGLLSSTWLDVNQPFLDAIKAMDTLPNLQSFPCFTA
ncbi:hypothetical protein AC1031_019693 [Aphanomyces cochlioides]|nr:hypothetical protein AC1031_019693 [Aphanomyces cochlioides]